MNHFEVRSTEKGNVVFEIGSLGIIIPRGLILEGTIDCVPGTNMPDTGENTLNISREIESEYVQITVREFGRSETIRISPQLFRKVLELYEHG